MEDGRGVLNFIIAPKEKEEKSCGEVL